MVKEENPLFDNLVDLHVHLGGASAAHFLWELAHKQGIKLHTKDYWEFIDSITINEQKTYEEYLEYFNLTELIQSSSFGVERAVHHAISLLYRKGNITLTEIRFNPMLRNRDNEQDLDKIILGATVGMKKACLEYPVNAGLIIMMDRRFDSRLNIILAEKAVKFKNDGIIGVDLGGPIKPNFQVDDVVPAFKIARDAGLGITFHSGEVTDTAEMWSVMNKIAPDRFGHGVKSIEDEALLQKLAREDVTLEICPTSNLRTGIFNEWSDYKKVFSTLREHSVPFTVNSDGPIFLKTHVMEEFRNLINHGVIKEAEVAILTEVSRKASFLKSHIVENE
jgi:adenosine deaminase